MLDLGTHTCYNKYNNGTTRRAYLVDLHGPLNHERELVVAVEVGHETIDLMDHFVVLLDLRLDRRELLDELQRLLVRPLAFVVESTLRVCYGLVQCDL